MAYNLAIKNYDCVTFVNKIYIFKSKGEKLCKSHNMTTVPGA
eukprot:CAMPEP_0170453242 /NCGR_PEP_ID=MMETSP0123-20130129/1880_1 /TAXON_ID=182087 /ORGANISM="Favella ehrenbergii, Strain Fehren 1" /LENGTH=41 /DNA_ID= /DNA_START= /DNA_END= /DNA_ORIENTATION=